MLAFILIFLVFRGPFALCQGSNRTDPIIKAVIARGARLSNSVPCLYMKADRITRACLRLNGRRSNGSKHVAERPEDGCPSQIRKAAAWPFAVYWPLPSPCRRGSCFPRTGRCRDTGAAACRAPHDRPRLQSV